MPTRLFKFRTPRTHKSLLSRESCGRTCLVDQVAGLLRFDRVRGGKRGRAVDQSSRSLKPLIAQVVRKEVCRSCDRSPHQFQIQFGAHTNQCQGKEEEEEEGLYLRTETRKRGEMGSLEDVIVVMRVVVLVSSCMLLLAYGIHVARKICWHP